MHTCLRHLSHSLDFGPFYSPRDPPQIDFSQPSIALRLHGQPTHASGGENKEDVLAERTAAVDVAIVVRHSHLCLEKGVRGGFLHLKKLGHRRRLFFYEPR